MVIIEELVAPSAHSHSIDALPLHKTSNSQVEFVADVGDLDDTRQGDLASVDDSNIQRSTGTDKSFTLLLGLVIHAASDGLALGVANLARNEDGKQNPVSFIVFVALLLHKGKFLVLHAHIVTLFLYQPPLLWLLPPHCCQVIFLDPAARNMSPFSARRHP